MSPERPVCPGRPPHASLGVMGLRARAHANECLRPLPDSGTDRTPSRADPLGSTRGLGLVVSDIQLAFFSQAVRAIADTAPAQALRSSSRTRTRIWRPSERGSACWSTSGSTGCWSRPPVQRRPRICRRSRTAVPRWSCSTAVHPGCGATWSWSTTPARRAMRSATSCASAIRAWPSSWKTGRHAGGRAGQLAPGSRQRDAEPTAPARLGIRAPTGGLPVTDELILRAQYDRADARRVTAEALMSPSAPTALVTTDETMTLGALDAVRELGLGVPVGRVHGELRRHALDNHHPAATDDRRTARPGDRRDRGRLLLRRIGEFDGPPQTVVLRTTSCSGARLDRVGNGCWSQRGDLG